MGCAAGSGCCADCGGGDHGTTHLSGTHTNRIAGARNSALHSWLGATQCDQDGNCYTDGVLSAAPLTTGAGCAPGVASCSASTFSAPSSATLIYIGIGLLAVLMLEATSRRR